MTSTRAALLLVVLACACRPGGETAQGVAERFLDAHYVHMNLAGARELSVGPAREKIEEEQHLIGDQVVDASTRKPSVSYRLQERREEGADRVTFVYEGRIRVEDADTFTRRWMVTARREEGGWKVSNFQEFE